MSFVLWQVDAGMGVASARQVLRADEVAPLQEANALVQALAQACHGQSRRLQTELEAAHRRGLTQGLEEGRRQAQQELAQALASLEAKAAQERDQQRAAVAALALQVARKILGELPQAERLSALAAHAAQELLPARTLRLHVAPAMLEPVRERLAALAQPATGLVQARVLADPGLGPDACRLETDLGSADASLQAQLERLASALGVGPAA
jgi:type III secretion protein L